ncbi:ATP-binding protein [Desulfatiglans anilini]|uniref:ATP-binding protein n=1 Tax=Desulfatiglans anilini TaxID=90728 RepID=UPI00040B9129|nr:ATP-binding protein [Desulfatiglans anilini]
MVEHPPSLLNIGIVGGGKLAREVLEKTTSSYSQEDVKARYVAVVDPDPESPAVLFAKSIGLSVLEDYHALYDPSLDIHLILVLCRDEKVTDDVLKHSPDHIRIMTRAVFMMFWAATRLEEAKWRDRSLDMETILNGIQDFILVITPDRKIVEVNEAFLTKMGYTREQVVGHSCHEVFQKGNQPCNEGIIFCPMNEAIRNREPSQQVVTRIDSDGQPIYTEVTMFPIFEDNGRISKFIEVSRDITDRKREEERITQRLERMVEERTKALEETHAKLLHQDKMASLGKLSASVVHEINNPIAGILNLILLMKRISQEGRLTTEDLQKFARYLDLMETETRRISRIVSNLLTFSRQSKIELKLVDLNRLVQKTLFLNSNLLKIHNVSVVTDLDPGLPEVMGSEDHLQQIFMNLISNAAEAMEAMPGGTLTIRTGDVKEAGQVFITFEDNGPGIPKENLPRLFEPFFTTKTKGKGVGLGLSVAYGIIENHGGTIEVQSEPDKGTTFLVKLPVNREASQGA